MTDPRLASIQSALSDFEDGTLDVEGLQSRLQAEAARLDNSTPDVLRELTVLDNELERIRFTTLADDQQREAASLLPPLKDAIRRIA